MLTSLDFLSPGRDWPPPSERERLKLYEDNRKLFEGKHDQVFTDWIRLLREDQKATLEIILNWPKRLSTLWADLLLGEPPRITAGDKDSREQQQVERLISDNQLHNVAYEVAIDVSRFGTGLFKDRHDKRGIIEGQPPSCWFPVVDPTNVKNIIAHVLAWTWTEDTKNALGQLVTKKYLKAEIHERGKITTRKYLIDGNTISKQQELDLEPEEVLTGVDDFLVIPVNNLVTTDRVTGLDDYSDLDSIVQEIEIRVAQISRILDKHSDPNMYGPASALEVDPATGKTTYRAGGKYFPLNPEDDPPGYLTWDGQLEASFQEIDLLMEQFYVLSETSAAALGQLKSGLAESGTALRRLMLAPLAKVNRIRMRFDPALKKALQIVSALEVAQKTSGAIKLENIRIDWKDGLPEDPKEQTEIETQRKAAGLTSIESSLRRLDNLDGKDLAEEVARIKADESAQAPVMFKPNISPPGGGS